MIGNSVENTVNLLLLRALNETGKTVLWSSCIRYAFLHEFLALLRSSFGLARCGSVS